MTNNSQVIVLIALTKCTFSNLKQFIPEGFFDTENNPYQ